MSERERWIVYPLLFLTLGIALRNQFLPTRRFGAVDLRAGEISAQKIICNDLVIQETGKCNQFNCDQFQFNQALGKHIRAVGLAECTFLKAGEIESRAMLVVDANGKPAVIVSIDKNTQTGMLQIINATGKPAVEAGIDQNTQAGLLQINSATRAPLVRIGATNTGGAVSTVGRNGTVIVEMGVEGPNFGVFAKFPQTGLTFPLTSPNSLEPKIATPKPSQTPAPVTPPEKEKQPGGEKSP
jgi:hypothetical protein